MVPIMGEVEGKKCRTEILLIPLAPLLVPNSQRGFGLGNQLVTCHRQLFVFPGHVFTAQLHGHISCVGFYVVG